MHIFWNNTFSLSLVLFLSIQTVWLGQRARHTLQIPSRKRREDFLVSKQNLRSWAEYTLALANPDPWGTFVSPVLQLAACRVPCSRHIFPRRSPACRLLISGAMAAGTRWCWSGCQCGICACGVGGGCTWITPPDWTRNVLVFLWNARQESGGTFLGVIGGR